MNTRVIRSVIAAVILAAGGLCQVRASDSGDWSCVGGDPGMTKYTPDDIPATPSLSLDYVKRFYTGYCNDPGPAYHYSSSVLIQNGTAMVLDPDSPYTRSYYGIGLGLTFFNINSGAVTARTNYPNQQSGQNNGIWMGENVAEIDSNHFSAAMVWNSDGNIYMRRGGDHYSTAAYNPATSTWTSMQRLTSSPNYSDWGGDSGAFISAWGNNLVYRPGDTRDTTPYIATDISAVAFAGGTAGAWKQDLGPNGMTAGSADGLRYGDIPKISPSGIAVVCGYSESSPAQVVVQASNLATGGNLWSKSYASSPGTTGFYTSTSDYWRFVATDNYFVMFSGTTTKTVRILNMADGSEKWNYAMPSGDDPIMATHGNDLYVVGKSKQVKLNLSTGAVEWSQSNAFGTDANYAIGNDVIYRPMVLTDDTMWFIDGGNGLGQAGPRRHADKRRQSHQHDRPRRDGRQDGR